MRLKSCPIGHRWVLNKVAADIAGQLSDPELRREAAAMLVLTLFEDSEETEEPSNGLAEMLYANIRSRPRPRTAGRPADNSGGTA